MGDLGRASSDVTSGTKLKHSQDFWLSLKSYKDVNTHEESVSFKECTDFSVFHTLISPKIQQSENAMQL